MPRLLADYQQMFFPSKDQERLVREGGEEDIHNTASNA